MIRKHIWNQEQEDRRQIDPVIFERVGIGFGVVMMLVFLINSRVLAGKIHRAAGAPSDAFRQGENHTYTCPWSTGGKMSLETVTSGHDIELILGTEALRHILQLFMDVGNIPRTIELDGTEAVVGAWDGARRTYLAYDGAYYIQSFPDAFKARTYDFDEFDPDHVYISFSLIAGLPLDLYLRLRKSIDIQSELATLVADVNGEADANGQKIRYKILDSVKFTAALLTNVESYDHDDEYGGTQDRFKPIVDGLNSDLKGFVRTLREGANDDLLDQLARQLDPFAPLRLQTLAFRAFPDEHLGVFCNLDLLDHDAGALPSRGNPDAAQNFMPPGSDIALATAPGFFHHLVDTLLIRFVLAYQVQEGIDLLSEEEALAIMDGKHFPLFVPDAMVFGEKPVKDDDPDAAQDDDEEEEDEEDTEPRDTVLTLGVRDTLISTTKHTFKSRDGVETRAESLKVVIKTDADLGSAIGVTDENLVAFLTPIGRQVEGIEVAELGIDTNLRVDVFRSLLDAFAIGVLGRVFPSFLGGVLAALATLKLLLLFVVAIGNAIFNKKLDEEFSGELADDFGIEALSRLTLATKRWDPFYNTLHGLLIERRELRFEEERLFLAGTVHLAKHIEPYQKVYPRDLEYTGTGSIRRILYQAESWKSILEQDEFATDRAPYEHIAEDGEKGIYALEFATEPAEGSAAHRMDRDQLVKYIPFSPHCITPDSEEESHEYAIDEIGLLSWEEEEDIRDDLETQWINAAIDGLIDKLLSVTGGEVSEEQRELLYEELRETIEDTGEYAYYMENDFEADVKAKVLEAETIRLRIAPRAVHTLTAHHVLNLSGYQCVNREGTLYIRDIADRSKEDNLLQLPRCRTATAPQPDSPMPQF